MAPLQTFKPRAKPQKSPKASSLKEVALWRGRGRKRKKDVESEAVKKLRPTVILPPEKDVEDSDSNQVVKMEMFDPLLTVKVIY